MGSTGSFATQFLSSVRPASAGTGGNMAERLQRFGADRDAALSEARGKAEQNASQQYFSTLLGTANGKGVDKSWFSSAMNDIQDTYTLENYRRAKPAPNAPRASGILPTVPKSLLGE